MALPAEIKACQICCQNLNPTTRRSGGGGGPQLPLLCSAMYPITTVSRLHQINAAFIDSDPSVLLLSTAATSLLQKELNQSKPPPSLKAN